MADELVTSLATGLDVPPSRLVRWARTLRIGTDGRWVAVAVRERRDAGAQTLRRRLPPLLQGRFRHVVVADVEGGLMILACHSAGDDQARTALHTALTAASSTAPLLCGIGEFTDSLAATTGSCRQALEAVQAAAARADGPLIVVEYREALVEIVLGGHVVAADALHEAVLGPLQRHPYLVDTLQTLVDENLSQSAPPLEPSICIPTPSVTECGGSTS